MAAYAYAVTGAAWVRIAAVSSDFAVVLYRISSVGHAAERVFSRAAGWWLTHLAGDADASASPIEPVPVSEALPDSDNLGALCQEGKRLQTLLSDTQQRLRKVSDQLLAAMGPNTVVRNQRGLELARVIRPAPRYLVEPDDLPAEVHGLLEYPPADVIYA